MSHWSAVIPMNVRKHVCREKVAIILGDAPFLISKPFLQRMGAVLDLGKGQVTFNKLGVTMNLGESSTGHHVIDLISECETLTIARGSVIKHSEEPVEDSGILVENKEFSNLLRGSGLYCLDPGLDAQSSKKRATSLEGHLSCLTREEEVLIQKSCLQTWRGAECVLVQPRICATKTGPTGRKQRMFQEEDSFDFSRCCDPTSDLCSTATVFTWFCHCPSS